MKRHNIYLYNCNDNGSCKAVGTCRLDIYDDGKVRVSVNINRKALGIENYENVEIVSKILMGSGKTQRFSCRNASEPLFDCSTVLEFDAKDEIVGVAIFLQKNNGVKIQIKGLLPGKYYSESIEEKEEIKQVKSETKTEHLFVKLNPGDLTSLPRKYWHLAKNKFFMCGCNKYGHFGYVKKNDDYIICVPGDMGEKTLNCARKHGFATCVENVCEENLCYFMCQENRK